MMFKKFPKNQPTALDSYSTREGELVKTEKRDSVYDSMLFSYVATFLFVVIDFVCLNSSWTVVDNSSNSFTLLLISLGCSVILLSLIHI